MTSSATAVRTEAAVCCPSCQSQAHGNFCATCGETLHHHLPSAGEFAHEFIGHYVALEGKLLQTLKLLVFRPGALTIAFMRGRRQPYIAPLRLYLTFSLILFALIKWYGVELPQLRLETEVLGVEYVHTIAVAGKQGKHGTATLHMKYHEETSDGSLPEHAVRNQIRSAINIISKLNPGWGSNVEAFIAQPPQQQNATLNRGFLANLPVMLIAALPMFALYLKLLYRRTGRNYGEHLVFAMHANAFAFLLASIMTAVPGNVFWLVMAIWNQVWHLITLWDCVQLLPFVWLLAYLPVALQRVYGGNRLVTAGKWMVLLSAHVLVISVCAVFAELVSVVTHG